MAIDNKYGRVQLERGTIGEDEPVVVFRAQDRTLPWLLKVYRARCAEIGSPDRHLARIDDAAKRIAAWQGENFTQVPQSAGEVPE
jgi:hypothetical protein